MNFKTMKKFACLLLALLMLLSIVGCKGKTKKVKKVIRRTPAVEDVVEDNSNPNDDTSDIVTPPTETPDEPVKVRPERDLPTVADKLVIADDPIVHEFDYEYKDYKLSGGAIIVYGLTKWTNRYEGIKNYGTAAATPNTVEYTAENRIAANDLKVWFKNNYNVNLEVMMDTVYAEKVATGELTGDEQLIIVGDCKYHTSTLSEKDFAVKISGNNLIFEGGHFSAVESAVDWFRSVKAEQGKIAVLAGKHDNFNSQVTINGVTYDYIWGDEFDGYEFNDDDKWVQSTFGLERQDDMANVFDDPKFQYVENGKVRLTGDRYYDEGNSAIGYATSGQIDTNGTALFRNGYFEFYARLPYRRGGFPAIWTMTADAENSKVPNYSVNDGYGVYSKRCWDLEFDLFESFADADHMTTTIHKWYTSRYKNGQSITSISENPIRLTDEEKAMVEADQKYYRDLKMTYNAPDESAKYMIAEDDGTYTLGRYVIEFHFDDGIVDTFANRLSPYTNMSSSMATYAYSFSYDSKKSLGDNKGGKYDWTWYFNEETINDEYHLYSFLYTSTHCTVYMDGEPFLDFDWDPAYDYKDVDGDGIKDDISRNNNGVGFNFWQYFLVDMMIYTPNNFKIDYARKIQVGDCPFNLYIDYVRFYQDLDDTSQAVHYLNDIAVK